MTHGTNWQRSDARTNIDELLDAAKFRGVQKVLDLDGTFEVTFVPKKQSLEKLFSEPGPISSDDIDP